MIGWRGDGSLECVLVCVMFDGCMGIGGVGRESGLLFMCIKPDDMKSIFYLQVLPGYFQVNAPRFVPDFIVQIVNKIIALLCAFVMS
jgi:cellobiose-specific phosphotransferase system component IIC